MLSTRYVHEHGRERGWGELGGEGRDLFLGFCFVGVCDMGQTKLWRDQRVTHNPSTLLPHTVNPTHETRNPILADLNPMPPSLNRDDKPETLNPKP